MPELPVTSDRCVRRPEPRSDAGPGAYAELHCRTNFSFLEGASHADELVARAVELNLAALAVTDRNTLAGVVRVHAAAKPAGLKVLIGSEITPEDAPSLLVWGSRPARVWPTLADVDGWSPGRARKGAMSGSRSTMSPTTPPACSPASWCCRCCSRIGRRCRR